MKDEIRDLLRELQELKGRQFVISDKLADAVSREPGVMAALEEGLVRLNFPAPPGFARMLRDKRINH